MRLSAVANEFDLGFVAHPVHPPSGREPGTAVHAPLVVTPPRGETSVTRQLVPDDRLDLGKRQDDPVHFGRLRGEVRGQSDVLQ